jgi:ubiquinone/menaquinone biosynthesis C-methylase UbiE
MDLENVFDFDKFRIKNKLIMPWPKVLPILTPEQQRISDDFMHHWHEVLPKRYGIVDDFNHQYPVRHAPQQFTRTLEIGAGLGEHLLYERLTPEQKSQYVALELRQNMADRIKERFPEIRTSVGDCQARLGFPDGYFERILAIHVLEHLPNLPAAIAEMYRLCNKESGVFSVVIPCEGSLAYTIARRISAQRIFEKRYKQSYRWLIEREHLNKPQEILPELEKYFTIEHRGFFPLWFPLIFCNLCIGLTLKPKERLLSDESME